MADEADGVDLMQGVALLTRPGVLVDVQPLPALPLL